MARLQKADIPTCRIDSEGKIHVLEGGQVDISDLMTGKYQIIHAHPEALFNSAKGDELLESDVPVGAIIIDECHIIEEW